MSILSKIVSVLCILLWSTTAYAVEEPGPSASLLDNPVYSGGIGLVYTCSHSYYIDGNTGSDSNPGTMGQPWKTIQHADTLPRSPGDCINVNPATYSFSSHFQPTQGGNNASPTGYMVYRCTVLDQCFIVYNGLGGAGSNVIALTNPYYIFDGFDISGNPSTYGGIASTCFDSSVADTGIPTHHLWMLNNKIHDCALAGVGIGDTEWIFTLHNEVYNNAWTSQFEGSGIGLVVMKVLGTTGNPYPTYTPTAADNAFAPFHIITSWNYAHDNGCTTCTGVTDGYTLTADIHSNQTLDNIATPSTSSSFTASIVEAATNFQLVVSMMTSGTISVGQVVSGMGVAANTVVLSQVSGTPGGVGSYVLQTVAQTIASEAMTGASAQAVNDLVIGPCVLPFTYLNTASGSSATLSRPATCTQTGATFTFWGLPIMGHTDGNGIIMDTWCGTTCGGTGIDYAAQALVSFNDVQFNGGRGVHVFAASNITVANNSAYRNGLDITFTGLLADLSEAGGVDNHWFSNIAHAFNNNGTMCLFSECNLSLIAGNGRGVVDTDILWFNQVLFGASGIGLFDNDASVPYFVEANNKSNSDPMYVDQTSLIHGDLHLSSGSPAINYAYGAAFPFLPRGTTDAGAYQTGGTRTTNFIGLQEFTGFITPTTLNTPATPLSCSQATTFLARTSGLDRVHSDGYKNLICGLVQDGTWCGSLIDAIWITATQNQSAANLNLCGTNYTLIPNGSPNWVANQGYIGVAGSTTVWIDTQINPFSGTTNFSTNSAHLSLWSLTNIGTSDIPMGVQTFGNVSWILPSFNGAMVVDVNDAAQDFTEFTNADATGFYLGNRSGAGSVQGYKNAQQVITSTQASGAAIVSSDIALLAFNNSGSIQQGEARRIAMATVGASLTQAQVTSICHRGNLFLSAIGATAGGIC